MDTEKVDEVYDALARGAGDVPEDPSTIDALLDRVFEARQSSKVEDRLAALRVAHALVDHSGLDLIETFVDDDAVEVRRFAFNLGVAAKHKGLRIIRDTAGDPEPELALEALRLLTIAVDKPATTRARNLLQSDEPRVRAAAVRLLGHIAGPAVKRDLDELADDPDPRVRQAVDEATRRVLGEIPRNEPGTWWDDPADVPRLTPATETLAPEALTPTDTIDPDRVGHDKDPLESTWGPEVDSDEPLWEPQVPPETEGPIEPQPEWDADSWVELPEPLPSQAYGLLRLLGMVAPDDREAILGALHGADPHAVVQNVERHRPGKDPARGRGIALAAAAFGKKSWMGTIRRLLKDPEPAVRAAAVQAMGALGGPSTLTAISGLLEDPSPRVREAAVRTLGEACATWNLLDILPQWLARVADDPAEGVQQARDDVLVAIGAAEE